MKVAFLMMKSEGLISWILWYWRSIVCQDFYQWDRPDKQVVTVF